MEILIGSLLSGGVVLSIAFLLLGLTWQWVMTGRLGLNYTIAGMNVFQFVVADVCQLASTSVRPRLLLNLGIAVLLLASYARVLASMFYFAFVERNWKYTLFTGFVLCILSYSLFLR
jgi:uncharacterized membrane protein